jgi:diguanylate cyclase (GGDEF)-like protein/PAS domain S-box-containing protein
MVSRVLIADDHEMVRRGLRSLLESSRRDIQVLEASNGREAVEKAIVSKPDLVILDVSMPLLDGFSAAREIKKVAASTPILILTFEKSSALTEMAKRIGVNGYITKDENAITLLRAVDAAMGRRTDEKPDSRIDLQSRNTQMKEDSTRSRTLAVTSPVVRVLLLHSEVACVERCLEEFADLQFQIDADVVLASEQCIQRLRTRYYDVVLAEYPIPRQQRTTTAQLLRLAGRNIPLIFVAHKMEPGTAADLIAKGATDCVEMDNLGQLPVAIRRAFNENTLRAEHNRVEERLQRTEAHYQALMGNSAFGICRCGMDGQFMDVNWALVTMLGCESKEELLGSNLAAEILHDPSNRAKLLGETGENGRMDPLEIAWSRKNGTSLTVRLSGREVNTGDGDRDGYEIIVEDVTKQREIEDDLRQQAARDPLTGLANYRHLLGVLDSEIKRFKRTGREFALLLFDLDRLKKINDRYGHLTGSEALCRLAGVLVAGCRNIDTAARFGGDEFALVLPETGIEPAKSVAQRLCADLANDGREPKLSVSAGVAIYPADGATIETLLLVADKALYRNKSRVRD